MSRKLSKLGDGDDFKIVIKGWDCSKQEPTTKRDVNFGKYNPDLSKRTQDWSPFTDTLRDGLCHVRSPQVYFC